MQVFAFVHNPCVWESESRVVSLHESLAGAWRALRAHKVEEAVERREAHLRYGQPYDPKWSATSQWWGVRTFEVQP